MAAVIFYAQGNGVEGAVADALGGVEADCSEAGRIVFEGREETDVCQRRDMAARLGCYVYSGGELHDVGGEVRSLARLSSTPIACA
ncbi:MAG TPA: hypothetical protein VK915_02430 [Gaiellaceae bacterium]|nr:hypothetical protein [Gaiellaceae bacterium]